jgi:hypothetical protein
VPFLSSTLPTVEVIRTFDISIKGKRNGSDAVDEVVIAI